MRGSCTGALSRTYLHSGITEALWYAVAETERLFEARMSHAVMLAALYGNPRAELDKGNEQIHEMYIGALGTIPYLGDLSRRRKSDTDELVEEWRRINADAAAQGENKGTDGTEEGGHD